MLRRPDVLMRAVRRSLAARAITGTGCRGWSGHARAFAHHLSSRLVGSLLLASAVIVLPSAARAGAAVPPDWIPAAAPVAGLNPPAADPNPQVNLARVSCPAAGSCVAVGSYQGSPDNGNADPVIETLADGTWAAMSPPLDALTPPEHAVSDTGGDRLSDLSCPSAGQCVAVGYYLTSYFGIEGLIETDVGGTWTATTAPQAGLSPAPSQYLQLTNVSCPAASFCVALGRYITYDSAGVPHVYGAIETLSGGSWTTANAPTGLNSISCGAPGSCVAAGDDGVLDVLSGGAWTTSSVPVTGLNPPPSGQAVSAGEVACPTPAWCAVPEYYTDSSGSEHSFIARLSDGTWSVITVPSLVGDRMSCPVAGWCAFTGGPAPISVLSDGTVTTTALDTGSLNPLPPYLYTVGMTGDPSCPAPGSCVAVGEYTDAAGHRQGLIATLASGNWSAITEPVTGLSPAAGPEPGPGGPGDPLNDVACADASTCIAVGGYIDSSGNLQGLIETLQARQPQTIGFTSTPPASATIGGTPYLVTATGGGSANPVTFAIDPASTSGCAISGSTVSFSSPPGTCIIDASQQGNSSYQPAPQATQSFTVSPAHLTITASSPTLTYGSTVPPITPGYAGFVNGDNPASLTSQPACSTTATSSSPVGTYPATCSGADDPSYTISYVPGTVTITPAAPPITWPAPTPITYGTPLTAAQLNATSTVMGTFSYSPPAGTVLQPGSQALTVTFTPTDSTDYTQVTATATIAVNFTQPCITTTVSGPLTIGNGQAICLSTGGDITGAVKITAGGALWIKGGTIGGSLHATSAAALTLCAATVTGSVTVTGSTGPVILGGPGCTSDTIGGAIHASGNTAGLTIQGDQVGGSLSISGNSGGETLTGNTATGSATVTTNTGVSFTSNTITGSLVITSNTGGFIYSDNTIGGHITNSGNS